MANISHSAITDPNIHEPKGVASADAETVYVADGSGSGDWSDIFVQGFEDWNSTLTAQNLTASSWVDLNNNGAGTFTNTTYRLPGTTSLWDTSNNEFDWSSLNLGDTVDIRVDVTFTTSASNDEVALRLDVAHGDAAEFPIEFFRRAFKTAGTYNIVIPVSLYMGSSAILTNPTKIAAFADTASDTCLVNGWFIRVVPMNPVYA